MWYESIDLKAFRTIIDEVVFIITGEAFVLIGVGIIRRAVGDDLMTTNHTTVI